MPLTLSSVYYFNSEIAFKPYVGLGLNYKFFFDEEGGANLEAGADDLDLERYDSWGLSAQVGFDFDLGINLLLNASVCYFDIDTEAILKVKDGSNALGLPQGARITIDVDIDPIVYYVMIS